MNLDQGIVFAVLGISLMLFIWNRLRFDVVSMLALLAMALTGLVPADDVFSGFGHPAVITVAAVLVISQGLVNGGVVDVIARLLGRIGHRPTLQVLTLTSVVALCSGFINNVGALALLMPVAIWMSRDAGRSPSLLLMPLAFGSLLGGTMTLIGTPPNIIISSYRPSGAFTMFDFAPVGLAVTVAVWASSQQKVTPGTRARTRKDRRRSTLAKAGAPAAATKWASRSRVTRASRHGSGDGPPV